MHPVALVMKDLQLNPNVKRQQSLKALTGILSSSVGTTSAKQAIISKDLDTNIIDVGEQVDCLMQLASHPNVLVRQWEGLMAWL